MSMIRWGLAEGGQPLLSVMSLYGDGHACSAGPPAKMRHGSALQRDRPSCLAGVVVNLCGRTGRNRRRLPLGVDVVAVVAGA